MNWCTKFSHLIYFAISIKNVVGMLHVSLPQTRLSRNIEDVLLYFIPCTDPSSTALLALESLVLLQLFKSCFCFLSAR